MMIKKMKINTTISLVVVVFLSTLSSIGAQITDPVEVNALLAVEQNMIDPRKFLKKWNKDTNPCTSNWTSVLCFNDSFPTDGYLHVRELDFMWNKIMGSIPKEISNIKSLFGRDFLVDFSELSVSKLTAFVVSNMFAFSCLCGHMNNNSISGPIPPELSRLPSLVHFLLDNNNLSGPLPPEFSKLPNMLIILITTTLMGEFQILTAT